MVQVVGLIYIFRCSLRFCFCNMPSAMFVLHYWQGCFRLIKWVLVDFLKTRIQQGENVPKHGKAHLFTTAIQPTHLSSLLGLYVLLVTLWLRMVSLACGVALYQHLLGLFLPVSCGWRASWLTAIEEMFPAWHCICLHFNKSERQWHRRPIS